MISQVSYKKEYASEDAFNAEFEWLKESHSGAKPIAKYSTLLRYGYMLFRPEDEAAEAWMIAYMDDVINGFERVPFSPKH